MFAPGFFAAEYFAPGYWPEATAAVPGEMAAIIAGTSQLMATGEAVSSASGDMAAVIAGVASLTATGIAAGVPITVPTFTGGHVGRGRMRGAMRSPVWTPAPRITADIAATMAGRATMRATAHGVASLSAFSAGGSHVSADPVASRRNFARADNAFWLLAA